MLAVKHWKLEDEEKRMRDRKLAHYDSLVARGLITEELPKKEGAA